MPWPGTATATAVAVASVLVQVVVGGSSGTSPHDADILDRDFDYSDEAVAVGDAQSGEPTQNGGSNQGYDDPDEDDHSFAAVSSARPPLRSADIDRIKGVLIRASAAPGLGLPEAASIATGLVALERNTASSADAAVPAEVYESLCRSVRVAPLHSSVELFHAATVVAAASDGCGEAVLTRGSPELQQAQAIIAAAVGEPTDGPPADPVAFYHALAAIKLLGTSSASDYLEATATERIRAAAAAAVPGELHGHLLAAAAELASGANGPKFKSMDALLKLAEAGIGRYYDPSLSRGTTLDELALTARGVAGLATSAGWRLADATGAGTAAAASSLLATQHSDSATVLGPALAGLAALSAAELPPPLVVAAATQRLASKDTSDWTFWVEAGLAFGPQPAGLKVVGEIAGRELRAEQAGSSSGFALDLSGLGLIRGWHRIKIRAEAAGTIPRSVSSYVVITAEVAVSEATVMIERPPVPDDTDSSDIADRSDASNADADSVPKLHVDVIHRAVYPDSLTTAPLELDDQAVLTVRFQPVDRAGRPSWAQQAFARFTLAETGCESCSPGTLMPAQSSWPVV